MHALGVAVATWLFYAAAYTGYDKATQSWRPTQRCVDLVRVRGGIAASAWTKLAALVTLALFGTALLVAALLDPARAGTWTLAQRIANSLPDPNALLLHALLAATLHFAVSAVAKYRLLPNRMYWHSAQRVALMLGSLGLCALCALAARGARVVLQQQHGHQQGEQQLLLASPLAALGLGCAALHFVLIEGGATLEGMHCRPAAYTALGVACAPLAIEFAVQVVRVVM